VGTGPLDFREIFDQHYDYVWNSLRRLGVFGRDVDDLVDEVFLRIHTNLGSYDPTRPLRPWIFAFAFRAASDYRRLARHRIQLGLDNVDGLDAAPNPEEAFARREASRLVEGALEAISMNNRAVFVMYEIDGVDMKEIARSLEIPLHTAYSRLRLARATFAAKVRELRGEEGP
jgi:RNA polymerase sigma-70 factor (ECF subfamily)